MSCFNGIDGERSIAIPASGATRVEPPAVSSTLAGVATLFSLLEGVEPGPWATVNHYCGVAELELRLGTVWVKLILHPSGAVEARSSAAASLRVVRAVVTPVWGGGSVRPPTLEEAAARLRVEPREVEGVYEELRVIAEAVAEATPIVWLPGWRDGPHHCTSTEGLAGEPPLSLPWTAATAAHMLARARVEGWCGRLEAEARRAASALGVDLEIDLAASGGKLCLQVNGVPYPAASDSEREAALVAMGVAFARLAGGTLLVDELGMHGVESSRAALLAPRALLGKHR